MNELTEQEFIRNINNNLGIVNKVVNVYFMNSADREDVIQEMLFQLWKSYPGFRRSAKFSTWMYQVCLNTAITYFKKSKRQTYVEFSEDYKEIAADSTSLPDTQIAMLHQAIQKLSQVNKAIILLYLEDHTYEEIAQITGLSKTNVSVRLVRIKIQLEKEMKKEFSEAQNQEANAKF